MAGFSEALKELEAGERITRSGWNGKGMWLIFVNSGEWDVDAYLRFNSDGMHPFIAMRTADGGLVPWLASQTDILAKDWEVV